VTFHLYQINEVYSNADGSVQFIELLGTANGQEFLTEGSLTVTQGGVTHTFDPATDLPSSATNGKTVLFATAGFEALTGVAPDYTLPAGFLFTSGSQTIHWGVDTLSVPLLPTEGGLSVGQNGTTSAPNTPENFAGVSGSVPSNHAPAGADLLGDVFTGVGQPFSLTVPGNDFSDADNDPLTYTATLANNAALPSWLSFDSSTLVLGGTPAGGDVGTIQVKITASDGSASVSDAFALSVVAGFVVNGDAVDNNLSGSADDDIIFGFGGNDSLDGGAGNDTLVGGPGNDTYAVADGDVVTEGSAGGADTVLASASYTLGANVESLTLTGGASLNGTGNGLANAITGNPGANVLDGAAGSDTLAGGAGNDTYIVGGGDAVVEASGEGHDTEIALVKVRLGDNVEDLVLDPAALVFAGSGNALDNSLTGNGQSNLLLGAAGNDTLDGGSRGDAMAGGSGDDTFVVDTAEDRVIERVGQGIDTVLASVSYNLASAPGVENLTLGGTAASGRGNALDNTLEGNELSNRLSGAGGDDTLIGAAGSDTLSGGDGADRFVFDTLSGVDRISDFQSGVDQLAFDGGVFAALDPDHPFAALSYDAGTGQLFYESTLVAVLEHHAPLAAQDIVVLA